MCIPAVMRKAKTKPVYTSVGECFLRYKRDAIVRPAAKSAPISQSILNSSWALVNTNKKPRRIPAPAPCSEIFIQRLINKKILVMATPDNGRA